MRTKSTLLLMLVLIGFCSRTNGQGSCPPNVDFEWGSTANWTFYTGFCCPIATPTLTPPINGRHNMTVGATTDIYGGFPIVAPGGGLYSMRLGYDTINRLAEKARYYVRIPSGFVDFALVYRYAICLEDPGHTTTDQPRFEVTAYDSSTGLPIPCAAYSYISSSGLPGFTLSSVASRAGNGVDVLTKSWTTATINLTGLGGTTVGIDFAAGDCNLGGHFGYAYFDMSCGLFQVSGMTCDDTATTATLSAPLGFMAYHWYDSATFTVLYGTTASITIPIPAGPTHYAVILTPYAGYGCPDTLYTTLSPSHLTLHPTPDTLICSGSGGATITSGATDVALPLTYAWSPSTGLSCTSCANPVANPGTTTTYTVVVTNVMSCTKTATIRVRVGQVLSSTSSVDVSCHGYSDGTGTDIVTVGQPPFSYVWSSTPPQTSPTAIGLPGGTGGPATFVIYTVTVTDADGCSDVKTVTIHDGPITVLTIVGHTDPNQCLGNTGTITLGGLVPGGTFTISYLFGALPQSQTLTADVAGQVVLTGLTQGIYSNIGVVIVAGCPYNVVGPVALTDPPPPGQPVAGSNSPVCLNGTINLTALSSTAGVSYSWTGPLGFTSPFQNPNITPATYPTGGMYVVKATLANCYSKDSIWVNIIPLPIPSASNSSPVCSGDTLYLQGTSSNGASSYSWLGPDGMYSYYQNPKIGNITTAASGTYTVTVTLHGCVATATTDVVVNQTPGAPTVSDTEYCQHDIAGPLNAVGGNLLWYTVPAGGTASIVTPIPSTNNEGTTTWYVSQISGAGCEGPRVPINVQVDYLATPQLLIVDTVVCRGADILMNAIGTGNDMTSLTWYFNDGDSVKNQNPVVHPFDKTGSFTVIATAYYKVCPMKTVSKTINVFPQPEIYLGNDTTICPGGVAIQLNDTKNEGTKGSSWIWNDGSTHSYITITAPGTYYVKVSNNGCYATDTLIVYNDCYMNLPNVFSPNGDGINDYFFPRQYLTKGLITFNMQIFNRWGQLVYSTTGVDGRGWDGKFNDAPQPEGVFVYKIDATFKDGQIEHHTGNVTLLR